MDRLVIKVRKNIRNHQLIAKGDSVLLAVSGGVDSMVLLDVLRQIAVADGFSIAVAHFNHQLRGRAADLDEKLVGRYCVQHDLAFATGRGKVKELARAKKISVEMAAREMRLGFLSDTARKLKCKQVVLAHHADDQVELFYLRLFRGSGGDGLGGMDWRGAFPTDKALAVVRPLLDVTKTDLLDYAGREHVPYREDATNADTDILRNRVRKELVPHITGLFGEASASAVLRTMEVLRAEGELADAEARGWLEAGKRKSFTRLALAVQRQVIRRQLWSLGAVESFDLIESLRLQPDVWIQVSPGTFLCRSGSGHIQQGGPKDATFSETEQEVSLSDAHGEITFGRIHLNWERTLAPKRFQKPMPVSGVELFDAEKVGGVVRLRYWRPGDRFQPLGMAQPVKLQDWFVNRKVPMEQRRKLVVAEAVNGRIFWVEGQRIGEEFKLDKASRQRLKWQWQAEVPRKCSL